MRYALIYFVLLAAAFSCKKDDHPCKGKYTAPNYSFIDPSLDSYKFKENTYWVYRNDATAQLDSQQVVSTEHGYFSTGGGSSCSYGSVEQYQMQVKSSFTNILFHYTLVGINLYKDKNGTSVGTWGRLIFSREISSSQNSELEFMETIPSLTINGNTFQNVKKVWVKHLTGTYVDNLSDHELYYYFDEAAGLVKWEVVDGSTVLESWSIQSWEVFL